MVTERRIAVMTSDVHAKDQDCKIDGDSHDGACDDDDNDDDDVQMP